MKIILVTIMLIIIYYIYLQYNNDNFTNLKSNIWNIDSNNLHLDLIPNLNLKPSPWNIQSCGNNNNLIKINNDNILMAYNYDNINPDNTNDICNDYNTIDPIYNHDNTELRSAINNNSIFNSIIKHENIEYLLLGYANNKYYNQKFLIYESLNNNNKKTNNTFITNNFEYINNPQYNYALVKNTDNNTLKVLNIFGPRNKININDIVNLSYGVFQMGPLEITKIN